MDKQLTTFIEPPRHRARHAKRAILGLSVIGIGTLALLDNLHVFDIALLRTFWPLVFVIAGLFKLASSPQMGSLVFGVLLIGVGALMTASHLGWGDFDLRQWWPVFVILAGVSIALRGFYPRTPRPWRRSQFRSSVIEHTDEVSVDATFSNVKMQNDSRSFKGGRIAVSFGGVELDLREATMDGPEATLHINATFSGVQIRVPRDWQLSVQVASTMGAVEDNSLPPPSPQHRLVLRGETVFGGVEIKN